jgi:hypothetical protein
VLLELPKGISHVLRDQLSSLLFVLLVVVVVAIVIVSKKDFRQ